MSWRVGALCAGLGLAGCAQVHPPGDSAADVPADGGSSSIAPAGEGPRATVAVTRGQKTEPAPELRHVMVARRDASGRIVMECVTQGHRHDMRPLRVAEAQ